MYHNSVCRAPICRPLRFVHGDCRCRYIPMQRNKFDPLSLYGGLHGLSFDPTNTQVLLHAVSALQSTQGGRCSIRTLPDSPCQAASCSSSNSDTSFTRPSTRSPVPCSFQGRNRPQSVPVTGPTQACSSGSIPVDPSQESYPREKFIREKFLQDKFLEERFLRESQQYPRKDSSEGVQVGVGTSSKVSRNRKDLTWMDWGWAGTHVACPFNQRHLEDDSLIHPKRIGHMITRNLREVTISVAA